MNHQNLSMKVKVKLSDLISALEKNKQKHLDDYKIACEVYWEEAESELKKLYKEVKAKTAKQIYLHKNPPINNEKLYDKYIGMFTLTVDETIEITTEDYGCIVDDSWSWAVSASTANAFYSSKRA